MTVAPASDTSPASPPSPATGELAWSRAVAGSSAAILAAVGVGELAASVLGVASPVSAVARDVIDAAPKPVKNFAISTFGTADKTALGVGIFVLLVAAGAWLLRASTTRPVLRPVAVTVFALLGALAADIDQDGALALVPLALAAVVAGLGLWSLRSPPAPRPVGSSDSGSDIEAELRAELRAQTMVSSRWQAAVDRRAFVGRAAALSATGVAAGLISRGIVGSDEASVRSGAKLPAAPRSGPGAAPPVGPGASVGRGVEPFLTPNDSFYRIDTAFITPRIELESWRLTIDGKVDRPLSLRWEDLLERDVVERVVTLACVSNEVGGDYIGTARWLGIPLANLLNEAGVQAGGDQIAMTSVDGWTCGFPTAVALDGRDALLAIGMNGEPLPVRHGFPARIVVPGLYGYVSATKWIERIQLTGWNDFDGYWIPRGWAKKAPIKTQSRIDVPRKGATLDPGRTPIAGIAWAQHRGIRRVEVQIDDGPWREADLGDEPTVDAWRQWVIEWDATAGTHTLRVRATDGAGDTQIEQRSTPDPDGATGWHTIEVEVA